MGIRIRNRRARWVAVLAAVTLLTFASKGHAADIEAQLQAALTRLDAQEAELAAQRQMLLEMRRELARRSTEPVAVESTSVVPPVTATAAIGSSPTAASPQTSDHDTQVTAQQDDPTLAALDGFTRAFRIPDSSAALRMGGYVKADLIHNFDPLTVEDRFIVGSIPTSGEPPTDVKTQSQITAAQSRLNLDYRQATDEGILRAFVEGDFEGSGDTLRLRHAFGQWRAMLAGQTWSAFMDTAAAPEEIDFEGLNGKISVRQPQIRLSPQFTELGRRYQFVFSIEDPNPEVTDGTGLSQVPDLVASAQVNLADSSHYQLALLWRDIRAEWSTDPFRTEDAVGWGVSFSGSIATPLWSARDRIVFQLNGGRGIGRYVNDLNTVGDFDGVFSPTGKLQLLDVYAGYLSGQHWWNALVRSNLTFGYVQVDSPGYVPGLFYKRTYRASMNLMWTPTPGIDMGGEFLWGERENVDGSSGTATQIQLAAKYQF